MFHSLATQISITVTLRYLYFFFSGVSGFPPETRRVLQVEAWRLRGVNLSTPTKHLACSPRQSYPSRAEVPQALAPQTLALQAMYSDLAYFGGHRRYILPCLSSQPSIADD